MMTEAEIINKITQFVQQSMQGAEGGHDWRHIERVYKNAKTIAQTEKANIFIIELGALLHDIADAKFHGGDENIGPHTARLFLESLEVENGVIQHVENIIRHISFKGGNFKASFASPELAVVQDADRLDAMGAIGIARAFNYGGYKNREMYNPAMKPNLELTKEAYMNNATPTINHFYEKLLLLKDRMNTVTGKKLAAQRHDFMVQYLDQFYREINP